MKRTRQSHPLPRCLSFYFSISEDDLVKEWLDNRIFTPPETRKKIMLKNKVGRVDSRGLGPGAWGLGPGTWGLGPGAWSLGPGAWGLGPGAWGLGPGTCDLLVFKRE